MGIRQRIPPDPPQGGGGPSGQCQLPFAQGLIGSRIQVGQAFAVGLVEAVELLGGGGVADELVAG